MAQKQRRHRSSFTGEEEMKKEEKAAVSSG
jgi:hypothetical protein